MSTQNEKPLFIRKILQINLDGYNLVQDFYNTGEKRTDPFLLKADYEKPSRFRFNEFSYYKLPIKDSKVTAYYKNGNIESTLFPTETYYYLNGIKLFESISGQGIFYYASGQIHCVENFDSKNNIFRKVAWHSNGRIAYLIMDSEQTHWDENGQKIRKVIRDNTTSLFIETRWYNSGQIERKGYLRKVNESFKHHEKWNYWHENGQLYMSGNYREGLVDGTWHGWYRDGNKQFEKYYNQGKAQGIFKTWYNNGKIKLIESYRSGNKQGLFSSFHPFNENLFEIVFDNNIGTGQWVEWHNNGQKHIECYFDKGYKEELCSVWYENGQLETQGEMKNDRKYGAWHEWYENGQLKQQCNFMPIPKDLSDELKERYESHFSYYEEFYQADTKLADVLFGFPTGKICSWYENGHKQYQGQYNEEGIYTGFWQFWYDNGQLKTEGFYEGCFSLSGIWKFWNRTGEQIAEYINCNSFYAGEVPYEFRYELIY